jgi:hypothetical protein
MLIRVLEIPKPTGNFHFRGGEPQTFVEVDWFRDDVYPLTAETRQMYEDDLRKKRYFKEDRAYLVLHPTHTFTIGYDAP